MRHLLAVALLAALAVPSRAVGAREISPNPTFQSEGQSPEFFNITCDSFSWTTVVSSDVISRSVTFQWEPTSLSGVCLGSYTVASASCTVSTPIVFLSSATPAFTSYDQNRWNCRTKEVNAAPSRVMGYRSRDKGDYGWIDRKD